MIEIKPATVLGGLASKATGFLGSFTWKAWLIALGIAVAFAGVQTTRLAWAKETIANNDAKQARAIAEAVQLALEAERKAQANHDGREEQRRVDTESLKDAADAAPVGEKTKAVLESLRGPKPVAAR